MIIVVTHWGRIIIIIPLCQREINKERNNWFWGRSFFHDIFRGTNYPPPPPKGRNKIGSSLLGLFLLLLTALYHARTAHTHTYTRTRMSEVE